MSDLNDPIEILVDGALGVWALYQALKHPAIPTTAAYAKTLSLTKAGTIAAAAVVSGAVAAGGPIISAQQPISKPEEHVAAQTQENSVAHELETLVVGSTSEDRMWSNDDSAPMWSGNDFAPMWQTRGDTVRATRIG